MSIPLDIPEAVRQRLLNELRDRENVMWVAQPSGFSEASIIYVLFAIPWTIVSLLLLSVTEKSLDSLMVAPFILIGCGMLCTPIWLKWLARKSVYAITDQRAIFIEARFLGSFTIKSFTPDQMSVRFRKEYKDGSGHLQFWLFDYIDSDDKTILERECFEGIPQVKQVEALIHAMVATHQVEKREAEGE